MLVTADPIAEHPSGARSMLSTVTMHGTQQEDGDHVYIRRLATAVPTSTPAFLSVVIVEVTL